MGVKDIVAIALFTALIAAFGLIPAIPLPFIPVPITAQTLAIMLSGSILGAKRGFLSGILFLLLIAAGLPFLAGGRGGLGVFFLPTAGYLISYPIAAAVIGFLYQKIDQTPVLWKEIGVFIFGGIIIVHLSGIIALAYIATMSYTKVLLLDLAFIPGDLLKVAIATVVTRSIKKAFPDIFRM